MKGDEEDEKDRKERGQGADGGQEELRGVKVRRDV
jgi:hypothetical protein